eukprot:gnl/Spiro4/17813_TR9470_c0_g1_i1.p1 gnl/Spiro4/17813_TR9470_c0_g1~~gnl/Spiro4/17813_TR9470_c0_g1_i1.p1  ORF type:complete len:252 (-),score=17.18 gnl/Spiro4/17813_TR9470_c0_g1_i1:71-826(-)
MRITANISIQLDPAERDHPQTVQIVQLLQAFAQRPNVSFSMAPQQQQQLPNHDFASLLLRLLNNTSEAVLHDVSTRLNSIFETSPEPEALIRTFYEEFVKIAFSVEYVAREQSIESFFQFLPSFAEPHKGRFRKVLVEALIHELSRDRPSNCNRQDFFLQAEAFATLVKLDCIALDPAVTTMTLFISNPSKCCSGLTMLGKTVELCVDKLNAALPDNLEKLKQAIAQVTDPALQYDVSFVLQSTGWGSQPR